jgi:hypothetical protein
MEEALGTVLEAETPSIRDLARRKGRFCVPARLASTQQRHLARRADARHASVPDAVAQYRKRACVCQRCKCCDRDAKRWTISYVVTEGERPGS